MREVHQLYAHTVRFAHDAVFDGRLRFVPFHQFATALTLRVHTLDPAVVFRAAHGPPCFERASAVDGAFARECDVLGFVGVDHRLIVVAVHSLPTGQHDGILSQVERKEQTCALFQMKIDIALECDGAGVPYTCRNDHHASAVAAASSDCGIDRLVVEVLLVIGDGSVLTDVVGRLAESRCLDRFQNFGIDPFPCGRGILRGGPQTDCCEQ